VPGGPVAPQGHGIRGRILAGAAAALPRLLAGAAMAAAAAAHAQDRPEVVIDPGGVPPAALRAITEAVDAITRLAEDQDGGEANRLRRRARDATLSALATQGYFTPTVTLDAGQDVAGETWDIAIQPGPRATVGSVDIQFRGRLAGPGYDERMQALREGWTLAAGRTFINADWNRAKADLLAAASERDFYLARIAESSATVDPDAARVALRVVVDSGPRVTLGPLSTTGLQRVPESLVSRYVRYRPGAGYDRSRMEDWQQKLQATAFFRGAFVSLVQDGEGGAPAGGDPDDPAARAPGTPAPGSPPPDPSEPRAEQPDLMRQDEIELPVRVRVSEAPAKRFSSSLGFDDTAGVRFETLYRQNVVLGQPLTMETGLGVDRLRQRAYLDFYLPPDEKGQKDSIGLLADRSDIQGLRVTRYALGATRLRERRGSGRVEYETRFGVLGAYDQVKVDGGDRYDLPTLSTTAEWLRRDVDDKYDPREGHLIAVGGGLGVTLDEGKPFSRATLRGQRWWPVGERDVFTVRGELGKLWSDSRTQVPDDFGFRTGGARSIRGYKYLSIGRELHDAIVGASSLAVASVEYMRYFNERWGVGVFVDAGDAAESFGDMKLAVGYGVGARVRTPAGPLFLDVAYGQRERSLRLHFSLGIAF